MRKIKLHCVPKKTPKVQLAVTWTKRNGYLEFYSIASKEHDSSTFRKRPKNVLFDRAFNWLCWRSWTCRIAAPYKFCVDWLIVDWWNLPWTLYNAFYHILTTCMLLHCLGKIWVQICCVSKGAPFKLNLNIPIVR